VAGPVFHAGGEPEQLVLGEGLHWEHPLNRGPPDGERSGLVENGDPNPAE
jgi:hypothetical protein